MFMVFTECNFIENIRNVLDMTKLLRFGILQWYQSCASCQPEGFMQETSVGFILTLVDIPIFSAIKYDPSWFYFLVD